MASPQEKAQCVAWFIETKSATQVQRSFRTTYGRQPPSRKTIREWHKKFMETGSILQRKGGGRPSTSCEDVEHIRESFEHNPHKSIRTAARELQLPRSTVHKVLHTRLRLYELKDTMVGQQVQVSGYQELMHQVQERSKQTLFVYFCSSKGADGTSWCPDCVEAEPVVQAELQNLPAGSTFIYCQVGDRPYNILVFCSWKDGHNEFRKELKVTSIPTLLNHRSWWINSVASRSSCVCCSQKRFDIAHDMKSAASSFTGSSASKPWIWKDAKVIFRKTEH
uniref:thioredoxin domain-containing protein 17 isoform X2 n=1 Tax=Myxine glutinosa TaxID=7769 RepID=UPI0035902ADC